VPVIFVRVERPLGLTESGKSPRCKVLRLSFQLDASSMRTCRHDLANRSFYARSQVTIRLPLNGFSWNLILGIFRKSVEKIQVSLKSVKNDEHFT
jgi:hypothetical protein